jgi:hypothetical protein
MWLHECFPKLEELDLSFNRVGLFDGDSAGSSCIRILQTLSDAMWQSFSLLLPESHQYCLDYSAAAPGVE